MTVHKFASGLILTVLAFILSGCPQLNLPSTNATESDTPATRPAVAPTSTPADQTPTQGATSTTTQASTATTIPSTPEPQGSDLHIISQEDFPKNTTYLIQGQDISRYKAGTSLVVYGQTARTEIAIGLLKVTKINPDSLSAQTVLVNPYQQITPNLRVDDKLEHLATGELVPAEDYAVGYLLSPGVVRLRPDSKVQEGSILQALDLKVSGNTILDALPFDPPIEMNVIKMGQSGAVASVALVAGSNWPITGTIISIVEKPSPTSTTAPSPTATPAPTKQAASLVPIEPDGVEASRWSGSGPPENAFDGKTDTAWDLEDQSVGGWVVVHFRNPQTVSRIGIYHAPQSNLGQIREATLTFSDGSQQAIKLNGFNEWDYIDFIPVATTSIKVEITAVYPSSNRAFVVDIKFFGSIQKTQSDTPTPTASLIEVKSDGIEASRWSGSGPPENAFDGKTDTAWDLEDQSVGGWVVVHFRSPQTISRIGIYRDYRSVFPQIREATLTFSDGSQQTIKLAGLSGWDYVDFQSVTTTSVKLEITGIYPAGNKAYAFEIKFFGATLATQSDTTTLTTNLTEIKPDGIEASRWSGSGPPENAFDGKTDTAWDLEDQSVGGWVIVHFRNPQAISRIGIYRDYRSVFPQIQEATLTFSDGSQQTIKLTGLNGWDYVNFMQVTTTSIKLEITGIYPAGNKAYAFEIKFFGSN